MTENYVTEDELQQLKAELILEIKEHATPLQASKRFIKAKQAKEFLDCSSGTLFNYRTTGILNPKKVGGTFYYDSEEVKNLLQNDKKTNIKSVNN